MKKKTPSRENLPPVLKELISIPGLDFYRELKAIDIEKDKMETVKQAIDIESLQDISFNEDKKETMAAIPIETLAEVSKIIEQAKEDKQFECFFYGCFLKAVSDFRESKARFEVRAAAFLKALGVTTGKRQVEVNKMILFMDYVKLVQGFKNSEKLAPWAALEEIRKRYDMPSPEAVLKHIRGYVKANGFSTKHLKLMGVTLPGNPS